MRWKINSINYAQAVLGLIAILMVAIPLVLFIGATMAEWLGYRLPTLWALIRLFFGAGLVVLVLFGLLLAVELTQDHILNRRYAKSQGQKLRLEDGRYECQYCGSRQVQEKDTQCRVCEKNLN